VEGEEIARLQAHIDSAARVRADADACVRCGRLHV
jgi:hypothetical protein